MDRYITLVVFTYYISYRLQLSLQTIYNIAVEEKSYLATFCRL